MADCYLCEKPLIGKNITKEHLLLQSLGGRLKSKDLICRGCNSDCGDGSDAVLANQLLVFAHMLNVKREDGREHPKLLGRLEATGQPILVSADGSASLLPQKPKIMYLDEKKVNIQIKAPDMRTAKEQLIGLKRAYPKLDVEAMFATAQTTILEPGGSYNHDMAPLGGSDAECSVCRSLVSFYLLQNGDRRFVEHLFPLIRGESEWRTAPIGLFFPAEEPFALQNDKITHSLVVIGRPEDKVLFGHIEYFNVASYLVILNEDYSGPAFQASYVFDLETSSEIQVSPIYTDLSIEEIQRICNRRPLEQADLDGWSGRMNMFVEKLEVIKRKRHIREIVLSVIKTQYNKLDLSDFSESDIVSLVDYFYRGGLAEYEVSKRDLES